MDNTQLKQKTISIMIWNAFQSFGTMSISFISNIVLARILVPDDFGCIGMLSIFIVLSQVFIDGGFGSALIQKKDASNEDYSTIFYWNLIVAVILFIALYFASPAVARFYNMPVLCDVLRIVSIVLIINGFSVIQTTILTKQLKFKLIAKANLIATIIGVIVSIIAALMGFGVWSLVIKTILTSLIVAVLLWIYNEWRPLLCFSWKSFKKLFSFGSLLLFSRLLNSLFENLQSLVIGKFYTAKDLGFYSQAKRLDEIPSSSISRIVTNVTFPVFSKISDNFEVLNKAVRRNIVCTTYLLFPLEIMLIVVADSLIVTLFSEKWIETIPYFRIICIYSLFISLNAINTNIYIALGKSKLYFWVQFIKKVIGIGLLIAGMRFGVVGIAWSLSISGFLWWVIAACVNKRIMQYGFFEQVFDVSIALLFAILSGAVTYLVSLCLSFYPFVNLIILSALYVSGYLFLSHIFKLEPLLAYRSIVEDFIKKRRVK